MGLVGELHTFTVLYVDYEGRPLEKPQVVGLVTFGDGGIVHFLNADRRINDRHAYARCLETGRGTERLDPGYSIL
ncbi:MAG: hypothetical protein ACK8QZ_02720 [Anaerolineales bacterium]